MRDFWPFFVIFCEIFGIFVVLDVTRIVPHANIDHVSCFQSWLRMPRLSIVGVTDPMVTEAGWLWKFDKCYVLMLMTR